VALGAWTSGLGGVGVAVGVAVGVSMGTWKRKKNIISMKRNVKPGIEIVIFGRHVRREKTNEMTIGKRKRRNKIFEVQEIFGQKNLI
jgi:hypothetical protein